MLASLGIATHTPCLKLEVTSEEGKSFAMNKEDVLKVFERFGEVRSLRVLDSVVLVLFQDITSAYFAQKILDGRNIEKLRINLRVSWYGNQETTQAVPMHEIPEVESPEDSPPVVKYTCKFEIQIRNDKEFQVARRLIGSKGHHMKRIVSKCSHGAGHAHDVVKLRLRGRGSGFKEGPEQKESDEPLHMCISSKFEDKYRVAVAEVEKLLKQVYRDYAKFCKKKGLPVVQLAVQRLENVSGQINESSLQRLHELEQLEVLSSSEITEMIDIRNEARRQCNFAQADQIREFLKSKGVLLMDEKGARGRGGEVTTWKRIN